MNKLFREVYGQKHALRVLENHLISENLSHAYLIVGPDGTGKEYLARRFALYILDQGYLEKDLEYFSPEILNAHPDFLFVDGREGIKIDEIRTLIERINLSPNRSKRKVVVITDVENMGIEATNALLKTFEEPPQDTIIILTTISIKSIPETLASRGQKLKLKPLSEDEITKILEKKYKKEDLLRFIPFGRGNISKVEKMIREEKFAEEVMEKITDAEKIISGDSVLDSFQIIEKYDKKKDLKNFIETLLGEIGYKLKLQRKENNEKLIYMSENILNIYEKMNYNVNLKLLLEEMVLGAKFNG